jgi:exopolyphosphatase/guanosine-5'-triphosphate,3'-diphosphate pyrophosphatase
MNRAGLDATYAVPASVSLEEAELKAPTGLSHETESVAAARKGPVYAALDLGTNNCRLLIARQPAPGTEPAGFRIVDSFCRIVRLGEGVARTGRLSEAAMARTVAALKICGDRMQARHVSRARLIATEACRAAENSTEFLARVRESTGLSLEIIDRETEAFLATAGCAGLADPEAEGIVLFDIGGGSSEIVWLGRDPAKRGHSHRREDGPLRERVQAWESMKFGVVTLAERFGGEAVTDETFETMVSYVAQALEPFAARVGRAPRCSRFHLLGTSGTVTTIAGVFLDLQRYDRRKVDGLWMTGAEISGAIQALRGMSFEARAAHGCIGPDRADLVLAGCAIFEAIRRAFPTDRIRIADRGLREGILMQMMTADRIWSRGV